MAFSATATTTAATTFSRLFSLTTTTTTTTPLSTLHFRNSLSSFTPSLTLRRTSPPASFRRFSTAKTTASISPGEKLPESTFSYLDAENNVLTLTTTDLTAGKTAVIFAVPGAFTPTCSSKHVPSFLENAAALKSKGVTTIACVSVNDAFVMKAWKESLGCSVDDDRVLFLCDVNGEFTKAIGAELDLSDKPIGLGVRSRRYAMVVEDGVAKVVNMEEGGAFTFSGAEDMLKLV